MQIKGGEEFSHIRLQLKSLRSAESAAHNCIYWIGVDLIVWLIVLTRWKTTIMRFPALHVQSWSVHI